MAKFDPQKHQRRSIRLKEYDYSQSGAYFVTIVTWQREYLFGEIVKGEMRLNPRGEVVQKWWNEILNHFQNVETGAFVVMPNHIHGIIFIIERRGTVPVPEEKNTTQSGEKIENKLDDTNAGGNIPHGLDMNNTGGETPPLHPTLGQIVAYLKYQSTKEMNAISKTGVVTKFWQRNYYEHIIRDEKDLKNKTDYIEANPLLWDEDDENLINHKQG